VNRLLWAGAGALVLLAAALPWVNIALGADAGHTGSYVIQTCTDTGGNYLYSPVDNSLTCGNTSAAYERVLMTIIKDTEIGQRTEELVVIEAISNKKFALIYATDMAEQKIKHEIREAGDNVYKKGFIVDVNVEFRKGKLVAYRVSQFHQVIDLPDEKLAKELMK